MPFDLLRFCVVFVFRTYFQKLFNFQNDHVIYVKWNRPRIFNLHESYIFTIRMSDVSSSSHRRAQHSPPHRPIDNGNCLYELRVSCNYAVCLITFRIMPITARHRLGTKWRFPSSTFVLTSWLAKTKRFTCLRSYVTSRHLVFRIASNQVRRVQFPLYSYVISCSAPWGLVSVIRNRY